MIYLHRQQRQTNKNQTRGGLLKTSKIDLSSLTGGEPPAKKGKVKMTVCRKGLHILIGIVIGNIGSLFCTSFGYRCLPLPSTLSRFQPLSSRLYARDSVPADDSLFIKAPPSVTAPEPTNEDTILSVPQLTKIFTAMHKNRADSSNQLRHVKTSLEVSGYVRVTEEDMRLCAALNKGYLLRLNIEADCKGLDPKISRLFGDNEGSNNNNNKNIEKGDNNNGRGIFDGKVLLFRQRYGEERTNRRLIIQKLDYLQGSAIQRVAGDVLHYIEVLTGRAKFNKRRGRGRYFQDEGVGLQDFLAEQVSDSSSDTLLRTSLPDLFHSGKRNFFKVSHCE